MGSDYTVILEYINSLIFDVKVNDKLPEELEHIEELKSIDNALRNIRKSINDIAIGELSEKIYGKGYLNGVVKNLQATLKNITWQTKVVANGDFSQRIDFLGEFSDAFNAMVQKLEEIMIEVNEAKELFEMVFKTIPDATIITSFETGIVFECNDAFYELTGYSKEELKGKHVDSINLFKDPKTIESLDSILENEKSFHNVSFDIVNKFGKEINCLCSAQIIFINKESYVLAVIKNVTKINEIQNRLRESEERHRLLADNVNDVIWTMDLKGAFTYVSPSVEKLRGFTVEEVMKQSIEELLCPESAKYMEEGLVDAINLVGNNLPFKPFRGDLEQPCKDGTTVWTDTTVSGIYDKDKNFIGMVGVSRDITERKQMEENMLILSITDKLTQLYNRTKLDEFLRLQVEESIKKNRPCSLAILDIDFFKKVNDRFGHPTGDSVLIELSKILLNNIGKENQVGRWGGEEFMIIMPGINIEEAYTLAENIRKKIEKHNFEIVGNINVSFGVAELLEKSTEIELVARADMALYKAKESGRNRVVKATI